LENLLKYAKENLLCAALRISNENKIFFGHDIIKLNFTNPFKSIWKSALTEEIYNNNEVIISAEGVTLEGPLLHRSMVEKVGFVEKKFFIYADDTEYSVRLIKNGVKLGIAKEAKLNRLLPAPIDEHIFD
jgi:GT2 family glycosyltransferase